MPTSVTIADAVKEELNNHSFSQSFTAVRKFIPKYTLEELTTLRVTVVPKANEENLITRSDSQREVQIDIGIHKKIDSDEETEAPPLIALAEEIMQYIRKLKLTNAPGVFWVRTENNPIYSQEYLQKERVFFSLITVSYKLAG